MKLITEYSLWYILVCIAFAVIFTALLYYKNHKYAHFSDKILWVLRSLRFLSLFLLAFFLLKPLIQYIQSKEIKPKIILLQDNSQSLALSKDSAKFLTQYQQKMNQFTEALLTSFEVEVLPFDQKVQENKPIDFSGKQTNISSALRYVKDNYTYDNVGAVVLLSDGLYNVGQNPIYEDWTLKSAIYTVGLGDTSIQKDLYIPNVWSNKVTFLRNTFPVEIQMAADLCNGQSSLLTVSHDGQVVYSKKIEIQQASFFQKETVLLEAKKAGLQKYVIKLQPIQGEVNLTNNEYSVFIDVLDRKQKVLVLASAPHPDISALNYVLDKNEGSELEFSLLHSFSKSIQEYNLIIVHQPFIDKTQDALIQKIIQSNIPCLFIIGKSTSFVQWNSLLKNVVLQGNKNTFQESDLAFAQDFSLYTISPETQAKLKSFPPLLVPFGDFKVPTGSSIFAYQKISGISTQNPLVFYVVTQDKKMGFIAGEGIWRWKMFDYKNNQSFDAFDELISKQIQYLSIKETKGRFKVNHAPQYLEDQSIRFDAQWYNQNYELVNTPDVELSILNAQNQEFPFVFQKTANYYTLDAGILPIGEYTWSAKIKENDQEFVQKGRFSVVPVQLEALETTANHSLLYKLAKDHQGVYVHENELSKLANLLLNSEKIKTEVKNQKLFVDLVNVQWIFFLIIGLLTAEWFIKKYQGGI